MWTKPKMVAFTALTALLYAGLIYPVTQFNFFSGNADFLRFGTGIPMAFSFLFGPAAAWGTAIGNVLYDAATTGIRPISVFGFFANFLLAYIPYKLWSRLTVKKPDLRSIQKVGLFVGLAAITCGLVGLVIGWGLYWLTPFTFSMTAFVIAWSDALWAVILGSIILALSYYPISRHRLLYTDILNMKQPDPQVGTLRKAALIVLIISMILCFAIGTFTTINVYLLLPFAAVSVVAAALACK